jgi:hypothetical protein
MKATGHWGIAGPGISAEWTQGGESEWNSMGAAPSETSARCGRDFVVPRAGSYKVWVRYVDHRKLTEPFTVSIQQAASPRVVGNSACSRSCGRTMSTSSTGDSPSLGVIEGKLAAGSARLEVIIDKPGEGWRQVDAILITMIRTTRRRAARSHPSRTRSRFELRPADARRGAGAARPGRSRRLERAPRLGGRDFSHVDRHRRRSKWWERRTSTR